MTGNMKLGGCLTFWSISENTSRGSLLDGVTRLGLNAICPEPRTPPACLRDALEECVPARQGWKVFKKKRHDAFEVLSIIYREPPFDNEYLKRFDFSINEEREITMRPWRPELLEGVLAGFNKQLGLIRAAQVSAMMVEYAYSLRGTRIRPYEGI